MARTWLVCCAVAWTLGAVAVAAAEQPAANTPKNDLGGNPATGGAGALAKPENPLAARIPHFIRATRNERNRTQTLETSIVRYVRPAGDPARHTVDLISALHVGEKSYYERLNQQFKEYDVVLYELITAANSAKGKDWAPLTAPKHPDKKTRLARMMNIEDQGDYLDLRPANLVHADITLEAEDDLTGADTWEEWLVDQGSRQAGTPHADGVGKADALLTFLAKDRFAAMKRMLSKQMVMKRDYTQGPGGKLHVERNKIAVRALTEQIKLGKQKLAIFYGAAHMPDVEQRLRTELGLEPSSSEWLVAWDMRTPAETPPAGAPTPTATTPK